MITKIVQVEKELIKVKNLLVNQSSLAFVQGIMQDATNSLEKLKPTIDSTLGVLDRPLVKSLLKTAKEVEGYFNSPILRSSMQKIAKDHIDCSQYISEQIRYQDVHVEPLNPPVYQKLMHPQDSERLSHIEEVLYDIQQSDNRVQAEEVEFSNFEFDGQKLSLLYKGKILTQLTGLEMILCCRIFSQKIGHQFSTLSLEEDLYPNDREETDYRRNKFKKVVSRLNNKIKKQTGIKKLFLYSMDFTIRQI